MGFIHRWYRAAASLLALPLMVLGVAAVANSPASAQAVATPSAHTTPHYVPGKTPASVQPYARSGNMTYHNGAVLHTTKSYAIFWEPTTLQDGSATHVSSSYNSLIQRYFQDVGGTSFYNILTQYYDTVSGSKQYIQNASSFGGAYVDTSAFPAPGSGCTTNCINDTQMQAEITKAINANGWPTGTGNMFYLFTSYGEDSCSSAAGGCFSTAYCAFHWSYSLNGTTVIYANMPYGATLPLSGPNCGSEPSPNGDTDADREISTVSHEQSEAITDGFWNSSGSAGLGWNGGSGGYEIGDKCGYKYGTYRTDNTSANELLNGHYYDMQMEWSNAAAKCVQTR